MRIQNFFSIKYITNDVGYPKTLGFFQIRSLERIAIILQKKDPQKRENKYAGNAYFHQKIMKQVA